jgi:hypothetical protein
MRTTKRRLKVAHKIPGRVRIKLPDNLSAEEEKTLIQDLKVSPDVSKVTVRGTSLIIEHAQDDVALTDVGSYLNKLFPEFEHWSDDFDAELAKSTADPWINKGVPLAFIGIAVYRGLKDGAFLAGESAFALAYIAFDIYWKFQQENVIRKIEKGLSKNDQSKLQV